MVGIVFLVLLHFVQLPLDSALRKKCSVGCICIGRKVHCFRVEPLRSIPVESELLFLTINGPNLSGNALRDKVHLQHLAIRGEHLSLVTAEFFKELSSLCKFDLVNTNLTALPVDIFSDMKSLWGMTLTRNKFTTLPIKIFANQQRVSHLCLDKNMLTTLLPYNFEGLTGLKVRNHADKI